MIEPARNALSTEDKHSGGEKGSQTDPVHMDHRAESSPDSPVTMASDEPQNLASEEAQRVVKICKRCMVSQQGQGVFCVRCGAELVPIRSVETSCIGDVVNEKYRIIEAIGSGGMGDVYLGLNEPLGQRVAIKFLNRKFTSDEKIVLRFLNEARSYCKVTHPNAVTLLEYGQHHDGSLYLITEYIDGKSLTDVIRAEGTLPLETIISIGIQVCEVLNAAHTQGVIHRDLKPDNLMLVEGFRGRYSVKVLDFGIAKIGDDDPHGGMTETGSVFGTPEFMSPEQARGESVDSRADLYALGIILYFLATAKLPFRGKNKFAVLNKQLNEVPRSPSEAREGVEVHPELEAIILKCLEKDPNRRPQEAEEIANWLESIEIVRRSEKRPTKRGTPSTGEAHSSSPGEPLKERSIHASSSLDNGNASTFGDEMASLSSFELSDDGPEDIDPIGPTIEEGASVVGQNSRVQLGTDDEPLKSGELSFRVDPSLGFPVRARSAMLAILMTFVVVGAVILLTGQDESESGTVGPSLNEGSVPNLVAFAHSNAVLKGAAVLVERGEFAAADQILRPLAEELESDEVRDEFDRLVRQASWARNEEMRLRAALTHNDCARSKEHMQTLMELSPGAATELHEAVESCGASNTLRLPVPTPPVVAAPETPRQEAAPLAREEVGTEASADPVSADPVSEGADSEDRGLIDRSAPESTEEVVIKPSDETSSDTFASEDTPSETFYSEGTPEERSESDEPSNPDLRQESSDEEPSDVSIGLPPRRI